MHQAGIIRDIKVPVERPFQVERTDHLQLQTEDQELHLQAPREEKRLKLVKGHIILHLVTEVNL